MDPSSGVRAQQLGDSALVGDLAGDDAGSEALGLRAQRTTGDSEDCVCVRHSISPTGDSPLVACGLVLTHNVERTKAACASQSSGTTIDRRGPRSVKIVDRDEGRSSRPGCSPDALFRVTGRGVGSALLPAWVRLARL